MAGKNGISINWNGLKDKLERGSANLADTQRLMTTIGVAMKAQTVRRFHEGVDPDGKAWEPSKRAAAAKGGKALVDTGRLRNSISYSAAPLEVHVGSNVEYARIHQLGGKAGRNKKVNIPARPYLGLSTEDQEEIADKVKGHLEGSFK